MSRKKGGAVKWVPAVVIDELDDIMQTEQVNVPSEAWHRMAKASKKGRQGLEPPLMGELRNLNRPGRKKKRGGLFG